MTVEHIPQPGIYRHFKGNLYQLVALAKHSETLEDMVVYRALYGEGGLWVRPLSMFVERVVHNGQSVERFRFEGPAEEPNESA